MPSSSFSSASKAKKTGARRVLRSFRTTPRLLEDEEMDDLLQRVLFSDAMLLPGGVRQLTTCCIDEWGAVQFGYDEPRHSNLFHTLVGEEGVPESRHLVSLLNVQVDDEHPHWIVMLVDVTHKRVLLVDSLSSATEPKRSKVNPSKNDVTIGNDNCKEDDNDDDDDDDDSAGQDLLQQFQLKSAQEAKAVEEKQRQLAVHDAVVACGPSDAELHVARMRFQFGTYLGEEQAAAWKFRYVTHGAQKDDYNCGVWVLEAIRHYQQIGGDSDFFCAQQLIDIDIKARRRLYSELLYPPTSTVGAK
jgi:hypothetical protein